MIQETFYKVQKNQPLLIAPAITVYIKSYVNTHGFETQLTKTNINKIKKQYEEFVKNNTSKEQENKPKTEEKPAEEVKMPKEEEKENVPKWRRNKKYSLMNIKDENLESLTMLTSEKIKIENFNAVDDEMGTESKSIDYYYPKKLEELPTHNESESNDGKTNDIELELLHSFFPSNGVSDAVDDAKNFLITHKFVRDESQIEVVRGPFAEYEKQVIDNKEFGNIYQDDEPNHVYVSEKVDEEFNEIANLFPAKMEFPEGVDPKVNKSTEAARRPEDRLPYEKPSRVVPILLEVNPKQECSFEQLYSQSFSTVDDDETKLRMSRKRQRDELSEIEENSEKSNFEPKDNSNLRVSKMPKIDENDEKVEYIEITVDNTETRKKAFKTYCEYKHRMDNLKARGNEDDLEEIKKIEIRLKRGLLSCANRDSKFRRIYELFIRDRAEYLEKRRLLSLYQTLWGSQEWNVVDRNNISREPKETIKKIAITDKSKFLLVRFRNFTFYDYQTLANNDTIFRS